MRITKGQLRRIIREEVNRVNRTRPSSRARRLSEADAGTDDIAYGWYQSPDGSSTYERHRVDDMEMADIVYDWYQSQPGTPTYKRHMGDRKMYDAVDARYNALKDIMGDRPVRYWIDAHHAYLVDSGMV